MSQNAEDWETVYSEIKGFGGLDSLVFDPVFAQYVRMYGTRRASPWCYSLFEFEVYSELKVSEPVVYPTLSRQYFEEITDGHIVNTEYHPYGVCWIDYDIDGDLDYFSVTPTGDDYLYQNDGSGTFSHIDPKDSGLNSDGVGSGITWADYDNDGDPDPFVPIQGGNNKLYRNEGNGVFVEVLDQPLVSDQGNTFDAAWGDYDNDGWVDLLATNCRIMGPSEGDANFLYHNNGDGTFTRVTDHAIAEEAGNNNSANWIDYDNDGDVDLFMPEWGLNNKLFNNNGDGTFSKVTDGVLVDSRGSSISSTWGDYDNDGDFDLFVANGYPGPEKDFLYRNNGDGSFTKIKDGSIANNIATSWNAQWGDVDNDGDLDLFVAAHSFNHMLYLNNGDGTFVEIVDDPCVSIFSASSSAVWGDIDNDGDLDLAVAALEGAMGTRLYRNVGNDNHFISIKCEGTVSNRSALGAVVKIKSTIAGKPVWQIRHVNASNGFRSQDALRAHFGLGGDATVIDSLIVSWPSGQKTVQTHVQTDQFLRITEPIPQGFLKTSFKADKVKGFSNQDVKFSDASICDPGTPIQSWEWDFNNDGTVDSRKQNPTYNYSAFIATNFTVKLTVSNGVQTKSFIQPDLIRLLGNVSILEINTETIDLGPINTAVDTSFYVYNRGEAADLFFITLSRYEENLQFNPGQFSLAGFDSQRVSVQVNPESLKQDKSYTVSFKVNAENSLGDQSLTKRIKFKTSTAASVAGGATPRAFDLSQNYPNPFNPETHIRYQLAGRSSVQLNIFNIQGQRVRTLVNQSQGEGNFDKIWDGKNESGNRVPSGTYLYTLSIVNDSRKLFFTKRMVLLN